MGNWHLIVYFEPFSTNDCNNLLQDISQPPKCKPAVHLINLRHYLLYFCGELALSSGIERNVINLSFTWPLLFVDSAGEATVMNLQFQAMELADCGLSLPPSDISPFFPAMMRYCASAVACVANWQQQAVTGVGSRLL